LLDSESGFVATGVVGGFGSSEGTTAEDSRVHTPTSSAGFCTAEASVRPGVDASATRQASSIKAFSLSFYYRS
jgi:hypothetical protein